LRDSGFDASIKAGERSQFDVVADGALVFSKQSEGRWPEAGEVVGLLGSDARRS
jgi:predicted Rdx family selenoprotein